MRCVQLPDWSPPHDPFEARPAKGRPGPSDDDDDNSDDAAAANCKELVFDCLLVFVIFARGTKKIFAMTASILSLLFIKASKFQEDSSLTNFLHL